MNAALRWVAVSAGLLAILVATLLIFGLPVGESLRLLVAGAAGDKFGVARTLVKMTPLLLTGLGVTVAWRAGMFNIGGEGQFIVGGICGALVARPLILAGHSPAALITASVLISAVIGGGLYGMLAAWLKIKRGVDVVISTILLNFIALQLLSYAVTGPLRARASTLPLSDPIPHAAMLFQPDRQTDLHAGVLIALLAAVGLWLFLFFTKPGFVLRVVGDNPRLAEINRFPAASYQLLSMALSGGLCGLAGAIEYLGISGQIGMGFTQQWGFLGIPVALLGALNPLALIPSSLVFGGLLAGSTNLARFSAAGDTLVFVVQGVAVLALVGFQTIRTKKKQVNADE